MRGVGVCDLPRPQATDYLGLVYHLYDSDGTDSETEEEKKEQRQKLAELHRRLK